MGPAGIRKRSAAAVGAAAVRTGAMAAGAAGSASAAVAYTAHFSASTGWSGSTEGTTTSPVLRNFG
jgi:hypothetical protein